MPVYLERYAAELAAWSQDIRNDGRTNKKGSIKYAHSRSTQRVRRHERFQFRQEPGVLTQYQSRFQEVPDHHLSEIV